MSALGLPVYITIIVEHGEGKSMVHHLTPGKDRNGVEVQYTVEDVENLDGLPPLKTTHRITWTEVKPE